MVNLGKIHFSVKYDNNKLDVRIIECQGLRDADGIGKSDPYVRLYLLPGKHHEVKTKTINNNLNPVFDDEFSFTLTLAQIPALTAVFQVFDSDFGKDQKLGEARFALADMNLNSRVEVNYWIELDEILEVPPRLRGKLSVSSTVVGSSVSKKYSTVSNASQHRQSYVDHSHKTETYTTGHHISELNRRLLHITGENKKIDVDTQLVIELIRKKVNDQINTQLVYKDIYKNLGPLRDDYNELAKIRAEIDWLTRENAVLQIRTDEIDEKIKDRTEKERELAQELEKMRHKHGLHLKEKSSLEYKKQVYESELTDVKNQFSQVQEQMRLAQIDYGTWEGERDISLEAVNLFNTEKERLYSTYAAAFEREIECPSIYWEYINPHADRLEEELRQMRGVHQQYTSNIRKLEEEEMGRLSTTLRHYDVGTNDHVHEFQLKISELETEVTALSMKIIDRKFALSEEQALFLAQLKAKEEALAFLAMEYEELKKKLQLRMGRVDSSEVSRYSKIISEEGSVMQSMDSRFASHDRQVIVGLSFTPQVNSEMDEVIGWNIEEHKDFVH